MTKFHDAMVYLGRRRGLEPFQCSDLKSLQGMLDRYGIEKALVSSFAATEFDVAYGNEQAFSAAAEDNRLTPCPVVIPNAGLEVGDEEAYIAGLVERGARCVALYPQACGVPLDRRVIGDLFDAIRKRRLPVAVFETPILAAASLAAEYPDVPIIVHSPGYRDRTLIPALRSAPNLHVSIMPNFAAYRGLAVLAEQIGADRILFASGYPVREPGAPISYLLYSTLCDEDVQKIASGNIERLMANVLADAPPPPAKAHTPAPRAGGLCDAVRERRPLPLEGIVDMHAHYGTYVKFPIWGGDADDLVAGMDRVGVDKIMVSHQAVLTPGYEPWGNDQVLEAMARYPKRIYGYATCHPVNDRLGIDEICRCIDAGMMGIKLHSAAGIPYDADAYAPVWRYAGERGLHVLLCTWGNLNSFESVFATYPEVRILVAHSGSAAPEMYIEFARRYPNVYLELCLSHAPYGLVEFFVRELGPERLLWGSDAPWMAIEHQIGRVVFADISEEAKRQILVENARSFIMSTER